MNAAVGYTYTPLPAPYLKLPYSPTRVITINTTDVNLHIAHANALQAIRKRLKDVNSSNRYSISQCLISIGIGFIRTAHVALYCGIKSNSATSRLNHCRKHGLISGGGRAGWQLTQLGRDAFNEYQAIIEPALKAYNEAMRDLQREYRDAAQEAAHNAYNSELENL